MDGEGMQVSCTLHLKDQEIWIISKIQLAGQKSQDKTTLAA